MLVECPSVRLDLLVALRLGDAKHDLEYGRITVDSDSFIFMNAE